MSLSTKRTAPPIADHELLRCIGRGSYGEVWLARGVTGAWRAVKVVYREDFEDDSTFEREFQGILAYEPLSRRHQGLVEILHVGRNERLGFYFYVMELGDDQHSKQDIEPVDYQPRTLRGDLLAHGSYELSQVREIALQLAEAIAFLHEHDLVHRDIKPANIIFVEGRAKLADIGLVAAHGQRTYVGTEGFSPPEGPGGVQGDVYALGKVIYELASGRDRMEFPAPPESFDSEAKRKEYLALDALVCRAAEPRVNKRYVDGKAFAQDLLALEQNQGMRAPRHLPKKGVAILAGLVIFALLIGVRFLPQNAPPTQGIGNPTNAFSSPIDGRVDEGGDSGDVLSGRVKITSWPRQARVLIDGVELKQLTPVEISTENTAHPELGSIAAGEELKIELLKEGFRKFTKFVEMPMDRAVSVHGQLDNWAPPIQGKDWVNHLGMKFEPTQAGHRLSTPLLLDDWMTWAEQGPEGFTERLLKKAQQASILSRSGESLEAAALPEKLAKGFVEWLRLEDQRLGFLSTGYYYELVPLTEKQLSELGFASPPQSANRQPLWQLSVLEHEGEIQVYCNPLGATVFLDDLQIGEMKEEPIILGPLEPGPYEVRLEKEGYQSKVRKVILKDDGEPVVLREILSQNNSVVFNQKDGWTNSVGMRLLPFSDSLMVSKFETTRAQYQLYLESQEKSTPTQRPEEGNLPVVNISRLEAEGFAQWLTKHERELGLLLEDFTYRLPSDQEWSQFAQLEEALGSPLELAEQVEQFPWQGNFWPPPDDWANYGVSERDGYLEAAPVGSFRPETKGIKDLSGNVAEWVSTAYDPQEPQSLGLVRGGSFLSERPSELWLSARYPIPSDKGDVDIGFRLVLERDTKSTSDNTGETVDEDGDIRISPLLELDEAP